MVIVPNLQRQNKIKSAVEDTANRPKTTSTLIKPDVNAMAKATSALQNMPISISSLSPVLFSKGPVKNPCTDKTRLKVRLDTVLENFPLFCPKCKKEMATWCFSNNSFSIVEQGKKYVWLLDNCYLQILCIN